MSTAGTAALVPPRGSGSGGRATEPSAVRDFSDNSAIAASVATAARQRTETPRRREHGPVFAGADDAPCGFRLGRSATIGLS